MPKSPSFHSTKFSLSDSDFEQLAKTVDPYIATGGFLAGIIIEVPEFPDGRASRQWQLISVSCGTIIGRSKKLPLLLTLPLPTVVESLASHFVSAEIKRFRSRET